MNYEYHGTQTLGASVIDADLKARPGLSVAPNAVDYEDIAGAKTVRVFFAAELSASDKSDLDTYFAEKGYA